ncbi:hypothetical protein, partial [Dyella sp.]|uniref:hypothetical protein n=1 Tax=Dyella sp. TaxID=1869338 RepID=UPI002ED60756
PRPPPVITATMMRFTHPCGRHHHEPPVEDLSRVREKSLGVDENIFLPIKAQTMSHYRVASLYLNRQNLREPDESRP